MLRIRLRRVGAKKQPSYRIVVAEAKFPRDGRFVEIIGHYNPRTEPSAVSVNEERALHWLGQGAQPSDSVKRIFGLTGTLDRFARLKAGQELSVLVQEADQAAGERPYPTKTRNEGQRGTSSATATKESRSTTVVEEVATVVETSEDTKDDVATEGEAASDIEASTEKTVVDVTETETEHPTGN